MTVRELELAVQQMLGEARSPAPENAMTSVELRTDVAEFLDELDDVFARSPRQREQSQWRLWMMDVDESTPATFAVAIVRPESTLLAAGQGEAAGLSAFIEGGYQGSADQVMDALARAGGVTLAPTRIDVPKLVLHAWASYEP